jgi:hypothetical protein
VIDATAPATHATAPPTTCRAVMPTAPRSHSHS